jgi:opacity protein-like surface antigen
LVLNAVAPTPRLEFEMNKNITLFVGANLKGSTYRTDDGFGTEQAGDTRLNNAVISYTEIRAGAGFDWKLSPEVKLTFEGGYVPYREFDFHRTNVRYHHEEGAPYASFALRGTF